MNLLSPYCTGSIILYVREVWLKAEMPERTLALLGSWHYAVPQNPIRASFSQQRESTQSLENPEFSTSPFLKSIFWLVPARISDANTGGQGQAQQAQRAREAEKTVVIFEGTFSWWAAWCMMIWVPWSPPWQSKGRTR